MSLRQRMQSMSATKKRVALAGGSLAALAAIGMAGIGGTNALFTSQAGSQTSTFAAGTVTLTQDATSQACTITNMAPGDEGTQQGNNYSNNAAPPNNPQCGKYTVDYGGSLQAWILLDVTVTSTAANPSSSSVGNKALFDGTSSGLQLGITGPQSGSTFQTGTPVCTTNSSGDQTCTSSSLNQEVYVVREPYTVNQGWTGTFMVNDALPPWADHGYQGSTATITLTAHAVQYANNHSSDCYASPCSANPYIVSASASATAQTVSLDYSAPVALTNPPFNGQNWTVTDLTQSGTTPDSCTVSAITDGTGAVPNQTTGTSELVLDLTGCTTAPKSGDLLDITYFSDGGGSYIVTPPVNSASAFAGSQTIGLLSVGA